MDYNLLMNMYYNLLMILNVEICIFRRGTYLEWTQAKDDADLNISDEESVAVMTP